MKTWILSICGIVLISVIANIILPEGKMKKYVKCIFSFLYLFIMLQPMLNLSFDNLGGIFKKGEEIKVDENFIEYINKSKNEALEVEIEKRLEKNGFCHVDIEIDAKFDKGIINIKLIHINLKNLVILNENKHININKEIKKIILEVVKIDEEKLIIYE